MIVGPTDGPALIGSYQPLSVCHVRHNLLPLPIWEMFHPHIVEDAIRPDVGRSTCSPTSWISIPLMCCLTWSPAFHMQLNISQANLSKSEMHHCSATPPRRDVSHFLALPDRAGGSVELNC